MQNYFKIKFYRKLSFLNLFSSFQEKKKYNSKYKIISTKIHHSEFLTFKKRTSETKTWQLEAMVVFSHGN